MLDLETRTAILRLHREGHGLRTIARALKVSRNAVRRVLASGRAEVPRLERPEQLGPHIELVEDLHERCAGNLVRVVEELEVSGIEVAYATLTAFCRRHGIGVKDKTPSGQYHFEPGEEMQHDTSPHRVRIGGVMRTVQCASLVLCFSRVLFAQVYTRWTRFECRVFLAEAIQYMGGAAGRAMLDNSSVIIARGRGANAVPADAMAAFSERFGFRFVAHEVGDANRSGRVERPFSYIENNFYPGRSFADIDDLNRQLRAWCDKVNRRPKRSLGFVPIEMHAIERSRLKPLPLYIPDVYDVHSRRVDVDGYVSLHTNRYSVPAGLLGRRVEIRETIDRVRIFDGHELVAEHRRHEPGARRASLLKEHRVQRGRCRPPPPTREETTLRAASEELGRLADALRRRHGGQASRAMRQLHRMWLEYPTEALIGAVRVALDHGLVDLERIERMVLRRIAGDFFRLPVEPGPDDTEEDDDDG